MINANFVFLALLFNAVGAASYLYRLVKGQIQPHAVTWTVWSLAPAVAFAAQVHDGVGLPALVTLFTGLGPAAVVVCLLARRSACWAVSRLDLVCGALSLAGLVLWFLFRRGEFAIGFAVLADALASIPTYRKAARYPWSESWLTYGCLTLSALITLATFTVWSFAHVAFAVYLAVLGATMSLVIMAGQRAATAGAD